MNFLYDLPGRIVLDMCLYLLTPTATLYGRLTQLFYVINN
jgi:hypothetical protein